MARRASMIAARPDVHYIGNATIWQGQNHAARYPDGRYPNNSGSLFGSTRNNLQFPGWFRQRNLSGYRSRSERPSDQRPTPFRSRLRVRHISRRHPAREPSGSWTEWGRGLPGDCRRLWLRRIWLWLRRSAPAARLSATRISRSPARSVRGDQPDLHPGSRYSDDARAENIKLRRNPSRSSSNRACTYMKACRPPHKFPQ